MAPRWLCYRVDLRLRPFGNVGRIALSFAVMEQYYQREGRLGALMPGSRLGRWPATRLPVRACSRPCVRLRVSSLFRLTAFALPAR
ncbi:MAG: hypothetical protein IPH43_16025 [Xanthomonadales bacterium]|nr:hypothetical protein [Xanthomonadales bacterium]